MYYGLLISPIVAGIPKTTAGGAALAGGATFTRVDATYFERAHAAGASAEHAACRTPPRSNTELPTDKLPRDPGKIVSEVASSAQRQEARSIARN